MIEVLAAMGVLIILVLLIGRVFGVTTSAWTVAEKDSRANADGRAVVDLIARELSAAVVGTSNLTMRLNSTALNTYGPPGQLLSDALYFVALNEEPDGANRAARQLAFYLRESPGQTNRFELMRGVSAQALTAYKDANWFSKGAANVLAENVVTFEVFIYLYQNNFAVEPDYASSGNTLLPYMADVYLELMSAEEAVKASALQNAGNDDDALDFVNRVAKTYVARAYFNHQAGHRGNR